MIDEKLIDRGLATLRNQADARHGLWQSECGGPDCECRKMVEAIAAAIVPAIRAATIEEAERRVRVMLQDDRNPQVEATPEEEKLAEDAADAFNHPSVGVPMSQRIGAMGDVVCSAIRSLAEKET